MTIDTHEIARLVDIYDYEKKEWIKHMATLTYLDEWGCFVTTWQGHLWNAPACGDIPDPDLDAFGEVTCVDGRSEKDGLRFLEVVNALFKTHFELSNFAGR